jgi:AraC-like DNA-binding protein
VAGAIVRLTSDSSPSRSVRWWFHGRTSYRAYASRVARESFCVSTRSTEATVLLEGGMTLELGARRQTIELAPGQVALVAPSTPHRLTVAPRSRFVIFDLPADARVEAVTVASSAPAARLTVLAERLCRHDGALPLGDVLDATRAPLLNLPGARVFEVEPVQHTRLMQRVRQHLEAHYTEAISLEQVARAFGIDPFYLSRSFKRDFGAPPQAYLQFLRTEHFVWELLHQASSGRTDLGRAAYGAGFGDYATFSRRIHTQFGKPPSNLVEVLDPDARPVA